MICFPQQQDNNSTEMVQLPLNARGCTKALIFYDVFKSQHAGIRLFYITIWCRSSELKEFKCGTIMGRDIAKSDIMKLFPPRCPTTSTLICIIVKQKHLGTAAT